MIKSRELGSFSFSREIKIPFRSPLEKAKAPETDGVAEAQAAEYIFSILLGWARGVRVGVGMYGEWIFMGYNICKIISEKTFVLVTENFLNRGDFSCSRVGERGGVA